MQSSGETRICVIGAGPCGLTALKNLLQAGCRNVVCYEESSSIGGNWAFTDDPHRSSVYACSHSISSRRMASFDDFPMPKDYPDFPSHRQLLAYFTDYARAFQLAPHIRLGAHVEHCALGGDGRWTVRVTANGETRAELFDSLLVCSGHHREALLPEYPGRFTGTIVHSSTTSAPTHSVASACSWSARATPPLILRSTSPASPRAPRSACAREPTSFRN
jgi:cation diffusion facilitator CzcD-associated flavoprotein CzcO